MSRTNVLMLAGRIAQMILGFAILGTTVRNMSYYGNGNELITYPGWMGAVTSALGSLGIIGLGNLSEESDGKRVRLVVLYADIYALVLATTSFAFLMRDVTEQYHGLENFTPPAVLAAILIAIITANIARNSKEWWKRSQSGVQDAEFGAKQSLEHDVQGHHCQCTCSKKVYVSSLTSSRPRSETATSMTIGSNEKEPPSYASNVN